jgi:hypothetical protein
VPAESDPDRRPPGGLEADQSKIAPKPILFRLLAFHAGLFRRHSCDETILPGTKPFSLLRAEVPKRWLINNLPNEAPPKR